jgi:hypothetical protein
VRLLARRRTPPRGGFFPSTGAAAAIRIPRPGRCNKDDGNVSLVFTRIHAKSTPDC